MTSIWVIHQGANGEAHQLISLRTKYKSKVGRYIRNNINDFYFMFSFFRSCPKYQCGDIAIKFNEMMTKTKLIIDDDRDAIIIKIEEILGNYTNSAIVDHLWAYCDDSEAEYANIEQLPVKSIIRL
jgi:hypothetical protein